MAEITYATKVWKGEFIDALIRHPEADLIIANNLGKRIVDIGETEQPYYRPELEAVRQCKTKYLVWYAGDVVPPDTDWISEAIPLLEKYPIVTCKWNFFDPGDMTETDFGWETYYFSDQCFIAKSDYMKNINYNVTHPVAERYPAHGGNSFERRVAQWLAHKQTPLAVLKNHSYRHLTTEEK